MGNGCQDTSFENIALGRPATQSTTYGHNKTRVFSHGGSCTQKIAPMLASYAVDGTRDPEYEHHTCTSTHNVTNNWWQVKLDKVYNLTEMKIYNRNTQKSRFMDFRVLVNSGTNGSFVTAHQSSSTEHTKDIIHILFEKPFLGDILKIEVPKGTLSLCEVEIIKCKHGYHGRMCTKQCSIPCINHDCNDFDGRCTIDCLDGYSWDSDKGGCKECSPGKYGTHCNEECNCRDKDVCDRVTGICPHGCPPGFTSGTCKEVCPKGTFGDECHKQCHCNDDSCNPAYGTCAHGCVAGYRGKSCQEFCQGGTYGLRCTKRCNCMNNDACNPIHGACPRGCAMGRMGSDCQQRCPEGSYGSGCKERCTCPFRWNCDRVNGKCPHGCPAGYKDGTCKIVCPRGTYGYDCKDTCHCRYNVCNKQYGTCKYGCAVGYRGITCQAFCARGEYGQYCTKTCRCSGSDTCNPIHGACPRGCASGYRGYDCQQHLRIFWLGMGKGAAVLFSKGLHFEVRQILLGPDVSLLAVSMFSSYC
ncbi:multiple epidermal growth factor-like domains protein 6 [Octopus sinensis]|uniref:Multiple epidermal growth factor-like domains protein 6 n=1 Tax=Octopus sinensis TaxID=2607531 RepID=A0A6P7T3U2_9MOLL|nr:multiple epidermal growth factor-like domains protein 6 [Octopus sinensis]